MSKFNIPCCHGSFESTDAVQLIQELVPTAKSYRDVFILRKTEPDAEKRLKLNSVNIDLAENIILRLLNFAGEKPFNIEV